MTGTAPKIQGPLPTGRVGGDQKEELASTGAGDPEARTRNFKILGGSHATAAGLCARDAARGRFHLDQDTKAGEAAAGKPRTRSESATPARPRAGAGHARWQRHPDRRAQPTDRSIPADRIRFDLAGCCSAQVASNAAQEPRKRKRQQAAGAR